MDMTKKDGGLLTDWSLNTMSIPVEKLRESGVDVKTDKVYVLSGYFKEDPTGRFEVGFHFRSSVVIEVDKENGLIETRNTIYRVDENESNFDLGDAIMSIYY